MSSVWGQRVPLFSLLGLLSALSSSGSMSSYTTSAYTPLPMHACFCIETCMEMPGACGGSLCPPNPQPHQADSIVFMLQTSGIQQARSGSRACMPPTTTRLTPASWYETNHVVKMALGNSGPGVRSQGAHRSLAPLPDIDV